jgi:hypothetical protein
MRSLNHPVDGTEAPVVTWDATCRKELSCIYKRLVTFTIDTEIRILLMLHQCMELYSCTRPSCLCTSSDFRHPFIHPGLMLLPLSRLAEARSCQSHDKRVRKIVTKNRFCKRLEGSLMISVREVSCAVKRYRFLCKIMLSEMPPETYSRETSREVVALISSSCTRVSLEDCSQHAFPVLINASVIMIVHFSTITL